MYKLIYLLNSSNFTRLLEKLVKFKKDFEFL